MFSSYHQKYTLQLPLMLSIFRLSPVGFCRDNWRRERKLGIDWRSQYYYTTLYAMYTRVATDEEDPTSEEDMHVLED